MRNHDLPTSGKEYTTTVLRPEHLSPGDVLLKARYPQWSNRNIQISLTPMIVVKVTKTRVVLRFERDTNAERTIRIVIRDGLVTTQREGDGRYGESYHLLTTDDEKVASIKATNAERGVKQEAKNAAEEFAAGMTRETAEAVIAAAQAYLATLPAAE